MEILMLGDSLIEWGDWDRLLPQYRILNRGFAGEMVEGLAARLHRELDRHPEADIVLIMSGTNNLLMGDRVFPALFSTMIPRIHLECPRSRIIINGIMPMPAARDRDIAEVNQALSDIAALTPNCRYLDTVAPFLEQCLPITHPGFLGDGVHLSTRGYQVWAQTIAGFLSTTGLGSG